ncbi:MAG: hypothetical protein WAL26_03690 [Mycobacterium sp.]
MQFPDEPAVVSVDVELLVENGYTETAQLPIQQLAQLFMCIVSQVVDRGSGRLEPTVSRIDERGEGVVER